MMLAMMAGRVALALVLLQVGCRHPIWHPVESTLFGR